MVDRDWTQNRNGTQKLAELAPVIVLATYVLSPVIKRIPPPNLR